MSGLITEVGVHLPIATWYDPSVRAFVLTQLGEYAELHPVDHQAIFSFAIPEGAFPASPGFGLKIHRLDRCPSARLASTFAQIVAETWRRLTKAGDLRIDRTEAERNSSGQILALAAYTNLRTQIPQTIRVQ